MNKERLWAEIDLDALAFNFQQVSAHVGRDVKILGTVKADAYGHGAVQVAHELTRLGASMLGVANVKEGLQLREAGVQSRILVLGATLPGEVRDAIENGITLTLSPPNILPVIAKHAVRQDRPAKVHIMLDTGMTRAGIDPDQAVALAQRVQKTPGIELEGVATHFPLADSSDHSFSFLQMSKFNVVLKDLARNGIEPPERHAANTSGMLTMPVSHLTMVRPGIALYGMAPDPSVEDKIERRPVLALKTRIAYVRDVKAGTGVGYGHTWAATQDTRLATLPIGYADGYDRAYSNCAFAIHRGRRVPVVGRVSMDYITVDLGPDIPAEIGDTVTLIGRESGEVITAEEMASWRGTIPYEVTCSLGLRVQRVYFRGQQEIPDASLNDRDEDLPGQSRATA